MTTIRAGIDIGNATTEVVLAREDEVVAAGRAPTRGRKGSPASITGAAALVRRLARRHGVEVGAAVVAPLRPVSTATVALPEPAVDTGRLRVLGAGSATVGGPGVAAGAPVAVGDEPGAGSAPVVLVAPRGTGWRETLAAAHRLADDDRLAAVLLADDEAVLVANRLDGRVPVVDQVDTGAVLRCSRVAVEVTGAGRPLRSLTDPLRLLQLLRPDEPRPADAAAVATLLTDVSNAVVGLVDGQSATPQERPAWVELRSGERVPLLAGRPVPGQERVGEVTAYALPPDLARVGVDDLFAVDLTEVSTSVRARRTAAASRPLGLASLGTEAPVDPAEALTEELGVPVVPTAGSEALAARAGALTTPGAPVGSVVVDLGGGTVDVVPPDGPVVAAGAGDLLTSSVAALTGVSAAAAEWVKRGPAHRVEAPQVLLAEDGTRQFLDRPLGADAVGRLVVPGPAGWLPVTDRLAPGEWRALRLALKVACIGANLARALRTADLGGAPVILVGGPVGDDEILSAVTGALPPGVVVARGRVGGTLGHRYAVAHGLLA